jgi:hypothetical protein
VTGRRPDAAAVGAWSGLLGVAVLLAGWVGVVGAVCVAAVVLAGLPRRVIGLVGLGSLACVPLFVLLAGLPARSEVSPAFVTDSLWPHRLAFVGLLLVSTWAVLDLGPHLQRGGDEVGSDRASDGSADPPVLPPAVAVGVVAVVAVGAVVASLAVLGA